MARKKDEPEVNEEVEQTDSQALMLYKKDAVNKYFKSKYEPIVEKRKGGFSEVGEGYVEGLATGERISLNRPLGRNNDN